MKKLIFALIALAFDQRLARSGHLAKLASLGVGIRALCSGTQPQMSAFTAFIFSSHCACDIALLAS